MHTPGRVAFHHRPPLQSTDEMFTVTWRTTPHTLNTVFNTHTVFNTVFNTVFDNHSILIQYGTLREGGGGGGQGGEGRAEGRAGEGRGGRGRRIHEHDVSGLEGQLTAPEAPSVQDPVRNGTKAFFVRSDRTERRAFLLQNSAFRGAEGPGSKEARRRKKARRLQCGRQ